MELRLTNCEWRKFVRAVRESQRLRRYVAAGQEKTMVELET